MQSGHYEKFVLLDDYRVLYQVILCNHYSITRFANVNYFISKCIFCEKFYFLFSQKPL